MSATFIKSGFRAKAALAASENGTLPAAEYWDDLWVQTLQLPMAKAGVAPYAAKLEAAPEEEVTLFEAKDINIVVTGGETPYRVLRATAPWKYLGFALGGTVMTFGLIALSQHRPSWRLAALAFVATLVIALLYDLPFDNLLLPPNGDF